VDNFFKYKLISGWAGQIGNFKEGKKMKKIISLLIVLVISFLLVPEASAEKTEQWKFIFNDSAGGQGSSNCTLKKQGGTVTADGDWNCTSSQGQYAYGSYSNSSVTIAGASISVTALGTATSPSAPPGYQISPFTLSISGKACNGHGKGTFKITFTTFGWPSSISGTLKGTRISGSGITAEAVPWIPLLMLDD
jgi:hypothetical protein